MTLIDNIQNLCSRENTTFVGLEREIGLGRGTIRNWEKSSPSIDKLQKVADYFKVSIDYLTGHSELPALSPKEENDIAKDLEKMLSDLSNDSEINFQGEPMDADERETLRIFIENSLRLAKQMANKKFNSTMNK